MGKILIAVVVLLTFVSFAWCSTEISFDIWDWTRPCQDIVLFEKWVKDLAKLGFTRIEISTPWRLLEPEPGKIDLSFIDERFAICKKAGLGMRLRINSYYKGAVPSWYKGDVWLSADGNDLAAHSNPVPSITDERFWQHYGSVCTAISKKYSGEDMYYNAFIGIHAELKWSDWFSYDASTLTFWRKSIAKPRPEWLRNIVSDDIILPNTPPRPQATDGLPDNDPNSKAFIAFREICWREAINKFTAAIRKGDPQAKISSPLGESYRKLSAQMSNLDYYGLSRGSDQIVHSYDFFWHANGAAWQTGASIAAFRGITSLPTVLEFDGPTLLTELNYSPALMLAFASSAAATGAGLKIANYSYYDDLPSSHKLLHELIKQWRFADTVMDLREHPKSKTMLLFLSKWANYCYREQTEWLHEAQFGAYRALQEIGVPVRVICEDNLSEDLSGYLGIYVAFSPPELIPTNDLTRLESLGLPAIIELPSIPQKTEYVKSGFYAKGVLGTVCVKPEGFVLCPCDVNTQVTFLECNKMKLIGKTGKKIVLGYPLGYLATKGPDTDIQLGVLNWALASVLIKDIE